MHAPRLPRIAVIASLGASLAALAACEGEAQAPVAEVGDEGEGEAEDESGAEADAGEGEEGEPEPVDSDGDGLTDEEEAELGTDPNKRDTDQDNYWDSWEVIEGTDPLDKDSRIYTGWWPYNPNKDALAQGSWAAADTAVGTPFPRDRFHDRHGELVDVYDFANFTINTTGEPAHFIIDISAQWCGPCHSMAAWLGGVANQENEGLRANFPSVPDKVHDLRVWWMTFIVEGGDGGPPDIADTQTWFEVHPDNYIPVFADEQQLVRQNFSGGFYPFVFLLDPELKIAAWSDGNDGGDPYAALAFVEGLP